MVIAVIGCASRVPAIAQDTKREQKAAKVKSGIKKLGIGESARVSVKLYNENRYKGYVSEATDDSFVVMDKDGNPHPVKYTDVKSIGGRSLSTGAKIGIGIGIGAGITVLIVFLIVAAND